MYVEVKIEYVNCREVIKIFGRCGSFAFKAVTMAHSTRHDKSHQIEQQMHDGHVRLSFGEKVGLSRTANEQGEHHAMPSE